MKNIKIIVATHKKYQMPEDQMYFPVQVGAEGKTKIEEYTQDNTGNNISLKNPYFCELTGLYWAWKNLEAENIGLVHYRRYFTTMRGKLLYLHTEKVSRLIDEKYIHKKLNKNDIIVHNKNFL